MKAVNKTIGIVMLTVAGLLIIYTVWAFTSCQSYISEAVAAGQLIVSESLYDVINFYMSNCAQYFIYALLLSGTGWFFIRGTLGQAKRAVQEAVIERSASENDDELDEWFEKMKEDK